MLPLRLQGLHFGAPQDGNYRRAGSWQASTSRSVHRQQAESHPSLFVKEAHLLVLELQPERQALGLGHI